ncbi:uncharacterized protein B4U79_19175, partial [Dinothrombium tinctorium]
MSNIGFTVSSLNREIENCYDKFKADNEISGHISHNRVRRMLDDLVVTIKNTISNYLDRNLGITEDKKVTHVKSVIQNDTEIIEENLDDNGEENFTSLPFEFNQSQYVQNDEKSSFSSDINRIVNNAKELVSNCSQLFAQMNNMKNNINGFNNDFQSLIMQHKDEERIAKNFIIYNLVESSSENVNERIIHDKTLMDIDIICLTETRITNDFTEKELLIENYKLFRCDSYSRSTGGVIIYVKRNINVKILDISSDVDDNWQIWLQISNKRIDQLIIGTIYHSPSKSDKIFIHNLERNLENIISSHSSLGIIIFGDFNINLLKKDSSSSKIIEIMNDLGFEQLLLEPSRIFNNKESLIDH